MTPSVRNLLLRVGFDALTAVRADRWLAPAARWQGVVLMLHRVRPARAGGFQPNAHLEVTPEFLDAVVSRLREMSVAVVDLDEAAERIEAGDDQRFAVLTFDDGYRDNVEHARPVLAAHGAPFTVFVATGMIDGTSTAWWLTLEEVLRRRGSIAVEIAGARRAFRTMDDAERSAVFRELAEWLRALPELQRRAAVRQLAERSAVDIPALLRSEMMSWDDLRDLAGDGLATIGGHTVDHSALASLDAEDARREIVAGLDRLEQQLGRRPRHFAYPFGGCREAGQREFDLVEDLGLATAVTTRRGMLRPGGQRRTAWPRLSLNGHFQSPREFDLLVSGVPFLLDRWRRGNFDAVA